VVSDFNPEERRAIRRETMTDLIDCVLGIVFCTTAIVAIISPLGRHWWIFIMTIVLGVASGGLFIARWARRGMFRALSTTEAETKTESNVESATLSGVGEA
jgi:hypothetical protein